MDLEKNDFESQLSEVGNSGKILSLLLKQLERDFHMSGFELTLDASIYRDYEKLHELIVDILSACIPHKVDKLTRLCYRMDLGDRNVSNIFSKYDAEKALLYLADAMIMRELKKVIFKYQLENQKN